jgi:hypothetical protein
MKILSLALVLISCLRSADAAEYRCEHYCSSWNQCYSRCAWFYSEQEMYEINQNRALQNLDRDTDGGRRRPSRGACIRAIESGVENGTYGCKD